MCNLLNLDRSKRVHFVGVLGVSMTGLAIFLKRLGYLVSGSDIKTQGSEELIKNGIMFYLGHYKETVMGAGAVIYTDAVRENNPEIVYAASHGIDLIDRASLLGRIMKMFHHSISVSGTHGKTTVTAMIAEIFAHAELNPTVHLGVNPSMMIGEREYFITEACEYKRNMLKLRGECRCLLNVDYDHTDCYSDLEDVKQAFKEYLENCPRKIICADDAECANLIDDDTLTFGFKEGCTVRCENEKSDALGRYAFDLAYRDSVLGRIQLAVLGRHNVCNALCAAAVSLSYGIDFEVIKGALELYQGVKRRMEFAGTLNGANVIVDYAHHPREIQAAFSALENTRRNKLITVFEPHTYSRLAALMDDFAASFKPCDQLILADIFAAREKKMPGVDSKKLMIKCRENGVDTRYIPTYARIVKYLKQTAKDGDVILILGAGDIDRVAELLTGVYRK